MFHNVANRKDLGNHELQSTTALLTVNCVWVGAAPAAHLGCHTSGHIYKDKLQVCINSGTCCEIIVSQHRPANHEAYSKAQVCE